MLMICCVSECERVVDSRTVTALYVAADFLYVFLWPSRDTSRKDSQGGRRGFERQFGELFWGLGWGVFVCFF